MGQSWSNSNNFIQFNLILNFALLYFPHHKIEIHHPFLTGHSKNKLCLVC